jgi:hypothetical protein
VVAKEEHVHLRRIPHLHYSFPLYVSRAVFATKTVGDRIMFLRGACGLAHLHHNNLRSLLSTPLPDMADTEPPTKRLFDTDDEDLDGRPAKRSW